MEGLQCTLSTVSNDEFTGQVQSIGINGIGHRIILKDVVQMKKKSLNNQNVVFIIDLSGSMWGSNSAIPTIEAVERSCDILFEKGFSFVQLIIFGNNTKEFTLNPEFYKSVLNNLKKKFYTDFDDGGTYPEKAFNVFEKYVMSNTCSTVDTFHTIFMTDGEFNGHNHSTKWQSFAINFKKTGKIMNFSAIGYDNDKLTNIKDMHSSFQSCGPCLYRSIKSKDEIVKIMQESVQQLQDMSLPKYDVILKNGSVLTLIEGEPVYSEFTMNIDGTPFDFIQQNVCGKSVSETWVFDVLNLELLIGLRTQKFSKEFKNIVDRNGNQREFKALFDKTLEFHRQVNEQFIKLKTQYTNVKSRKISVWKRLNNQMLTLCDTIRSIQDMCGKTLTDKKAYEMATQMRVNDRHLRTLQRRREMNATNQQKKSHFEIEIVQENPVILKCIETKPDGLKNEKTAELTVSIKDLNTMFRCFLSLESWEDSLETLFGIPIDYKSRTAGADDWSPARADVKNISFHNFISESGYADMLAYHIGGDDVIPTHEKVFHETWVRSAFDAANAVIPIATDPFFVSRTNILKERLAHMLIGTNLGFRNQHILFYVAVLRACFLKMIKDGVTQRSRFIIMLILNTFKIISDHLNVVFDKDQKPISKSDVLYEIATGNTAGYLMNSSWDPSIWILIANETDLENARLKFNKTTTIEQFKICLWSMALRSLYHNHFNWTENQTNGWTNPTTWGLPTSNELEQIARKDGQEALKNNMMTINRFSTRPTKIITDLNSYKSSTLFKSFVIMLSFADCLNDKIWENFNKSFMPNEVVCKIPETLGVLGTYFSQNDTVDNIIFEAYWDKIIYGDNCYPYRPFSNIASNVANKINSSYDKHLQTVLADIIDYEKFKTRYHETRYTPITLSNIQGDKLNILFNKVYNGEVNLEQFKIEMCNILGEPATTQINEELTNGVDVLKNLFEFCQKRQNIIVIKSTHLPESAPSNATSPFFLQKMSDSEFRTYYREIGLGWKTKKYSSWVKEYHPFMNEQLIFCDDEKTFVKRVSKYVKENLKDLSPELIKDFKTDASNYWTRFKKF